MENRTNSLNQLLERARRSGKKRLAVVSAAEGEVLRAVDEAEREGLIDGILVGSASDIRESCRQVDIDPEKFSIIDIGNPREAAGECCRLIRTGEADFMMKGAIKTGDFMKAILDKQEGLMMGRLLSHIAVFEVADHDRLLYVTDVAINIAPTLSEKAKIIQNAVDLARSVGCETPKVACLAAVELVNPDKMPDTVDSAALSVMAMRGQIKNCVVDGPLALDVAVSKEAVRIKGVKSPVAGNADILFAPDIICANVLYKALLFLAGAKAAAIVTGAIAPVVLTSRADDHSTKFFSIVLGAVGVASEK